MTPADRDLAAELRAVEDGHQARLATFEGRPVLLVKSDTHDGLYYAVTAVAGPDGLVMFTCTPVRHLPGYTTLVAMLPDKANRGWHDQLRSRQPGSLPCKHAARAAQRLARERVAYRVAVGPDNGKWACAQVTVEQHPLTDDDVFDGLPTG